MKKVLFLTLCFCMLPVCAFAAASSWAEESIKVAEERNIIPEGFEENWQKPITREEFCEGLIKSMAYNLDYEIDAFFEYAQGVGVKSAMDADGQHFTTVEKGEKITFNDCDNRYVLLAADMGIVQGKAEGVFAPDDFITREEAAVMLTRVTNLCSRSVGYSTVEFADFDNVSDWAKQAVKHMKSSQVMTGVGENMFDPKGIYTREQAIVTFIRQSEKAFWQGGTGFYSIRPTLERAIAKLDESPIIAVKETVFTDYGALVTVTYGGAMRVGGYGLFLVTSDGKQIDLYKEAPAYNNLGYKPLYENFKVNGKWLSFTFTFEEKLEQMNAVGTQIVTYHEEGTYLFIVDLETGEVTYEISENLYDCTQ